jgi:protein-S-isoprenylcysteine O-methyltransferase Ste14
MTARLVPAIGLPLLLLFGGAGRWDWPAAWVYLALLTAGMLAALFVFAKLQPDLAAERSGRWRDGKDWDKPLAFVVGLIGPAIVQLTCGLDKRFAWSPGMPRGLQLAAGLAFAASVAITAWAMAVNPFFSATVRIQSDRGHRPIDVGPYGAVRHPAYAAMMLATAAGPVLLGTWWGLLPGAAVIGVFAVRTAMEDRTLVAELPGYADYAARVRSRLIPGLW